MKNKKAGPKYDPFMRGQQISTLDGIDYFPWARRSGRTTMLVDRAIQIIFSGNTCVIRDHYKWGEDPRENKELFYKVIDRLTAEHGHLFQQGKIKINERGLKICIYDQELTFHPPILKTIIC